MNLEVFGPDGQPCNPDDIPDRATLPWTLAATTATGLSIVTTYYAVAFDDSECAFQSVVVPTGLPYAKWPEAVRAATPAAAFQAHADCIRRYAAPGPGLVPGAAEGPIVTAVITGMTVRSTPGRVSAGWEGTDPLTACMWVDRAPAVVRDDSALSRHCVFVTRASAAWDRRPPSALMEF